MNDPVQQVLAHLDEARLIVLLEEAVEQYSPSYLEEPAMEIFAARLSECGIPYIRQPLPESGGSPRANLIIELGPQPSTLMWVGHVDTVPQIEDEQCTWREGDILHGLGTADMKSGCAAAIEALAALAASGLELKRGLTLALVVGEEEYGDGSAALLEWRTTPLVVIGEPTGLVPCGEHYGYYEGLLTAHGNRAHAALPEIGDSAIHAMLSWIQQLLEGGLPPGVSINLREIRGGADLFMVAERCEAAVDIHAPPGMEREMVEELIEGACRRALETHPGCTLSHENLYWAGGYAHAADNPLLEPVHRAFTAIGRPWQPGAFRSHSDGSLFHQKGSLPLVCGPGRLEVAHTRHEHVSLEETREAARLYAALFVEACVR